MSRVGREIIDVPLNVRLETYNDGGLEMVSATGPKGVLIQEIKPCVKIVAETDGAKVRLTRTDDDKLSKELHGLYSRLIQNMIKGVTEGFTRTLILNGVGYKASLKGDDLVLSLGYSHPCEVAAETGIKFKVLTPAEVQNMNLGKDGIGVVIQVSGASKEQVGAVASRIRGLRKVEPYHLYGIRYSDEFVMRKESKSGKKADAKKK
jgi:large subunit ribosomal protein L6